jgi:hypothetical protein
MAAGPSLRSRPTHTIRSDIWWAWRGQRPVSEPETTPAAVSLSAAVVCEDAMLADRRDRPVTDTQYVPFSADCIESHYGQCDPDDRCYDTRDLMASVSRAPVSPPALAIPPSTRPRGYLPSPAD